VRGITTIDFPLTTPDRISLASRLEMFCFAGCIATMIA